MPSRHVETCRFEVDRKRIDSVNKRLRPSSFLPRNGASGAPETSVIGIDSLSEEDIWRLGSLYVAPPGRKLKGRADFSAATVYELSLDLIDDNEIEGRHSNIVDWPEDRGQWIDIAGQLALNSRFSRNPEV
ncbi:MAG: hypothetical protein NUW37_10945 [Planctomycetes bacterium]|nr:hypothetical protein [Planctomycetota bacterium]